MYEKVGNKKSRKKNRKISIFTILLWVFLISTMITITVNSIKNTNALEEEIIEMNLSVYDITSDKPNEKLDRVVLNTGIGKSQAILFVLELDGEADTDYEVGEIKIRPFGIKLSSREGKTYFGDSFHESSIWRYNDFLECFENAYRVEKGSLIHDKIEFCKIYNEKIGYYSQDYSIVGFEALYETHESITSNYYRIGGSNTVLIEIYNSTISHDIVKEDVYKTDIIDVNSLQEVMNYPYEELFVTDCIDLNDANSEIKWKPNIRYSRDLNIEHLKEGEDIEVVNDFIYLTNTTGEAYKLEEDDYEFTKIKIHENLNWEIYIKTRNNRNYTRYRSGTNSAEMELPPQMKVIGVKVVLKNVVNININSLEITANLHINSDIKSKRSYLDSILDVGYIRVYNDFDNGIAIPSNNTDLQIMYPVDRMDDFYRFDEIPNGNLLKEENYFLNSGNSFFCYNKKLNSKLGDYDESTYGEKLDRKQISTYKLVTGLDEASGAITLASALNDKDDCTIYGNSNGHCFEIKNKYMVYIKSGTVTNLGSILKIYNVLPEGVEVQKDNNYYLNATNVIIEDRRFNLNELNNRSSSFKIRPSQVNITKKNNETTNKTETVIEVIVNLSALRDIASLGRIDIELNYEALIRSENMIQEHGSIYSIKKYAMWENQDTFSYSPGYTKKISYIDSLRRYVLRFNHDLLINRDIFYLYNPFGNDIYEEDSELNNNSVLIDDYSDLDGDNNISEKVVYQEQLEKIKLFGATYQMTARKIWDDNENESGKRPESITIQLKKDDNVIREAVLNEENNWTYTFDLLFDFLFKDDRYTIDEKDTGSKFYTKEKIEKTSDTETTITNKFEVPDEKVNVEVIKTWNDNNNEARKRPENIKLQVKDGERVVSSHVVSEEDEWKYTFELPKYDSLGNEITYTVDEEYTNKFYIKEIVENTITNRFVVPEDKIKIVGTKIWEDNDNKALKRPKSVILQVIANNEVITEHEISDENNWSYEFEVPKYDELGNELEYCIDEKDTSEFYEKTVDGYTVINKYKNIDEDNGNNDIVDIDTSDMNIFVYVVIFFIAIIGVIVGIIFVKKERK